MTDQSAIAPQRWDTRQPLNHTDLTDFLALRRICGHPDFRCLHGEAGLLMENGRPLLPFIADGVTVLIEVGHATLGEPDPATGLRPVLVSASGRARYEHLCDRQAIPPYPTSASNTEPNR